MKVCKWLLIHRLLAFLEVGVRKGVCLSTDMSMQVCNGVLALVSNRMYVIMLFKGMCICCSQPCACMCLHVLLGRSCAQVCVYVCECIYLCLWAEHKMYVIGINIYCLKYTSVCILCIYM